MDRKYMDCREMPSDNNCDLAMSGSESHLVEAAAQHAITAHKHEDTPQLREDIRKQLKDEVPGVLA
jgi:predicted small metal-binding protein